MVTKRLSSLSSTNKIFQQARPPYDAALKTSGHKPTQNYTAPNTQTENLATKKNRSRRITWYNPPYNVSVKSNLGKSFLQLIDKHFPKGSMLNKIINRNNTKLSYSSTKNMGTIIKQHNRKVLASANKPPPIAQKMCNCKVPQNCPLKGRCLEQTVVYRASGTDAQGSFCYVGSTEGPFKTRFYGHSSDFRNPRKKNSTTLSALMWESSTPTRPTLTWDIVRKCKPYGGTSRKCDLCLQEKLEILRPRNATDRPLNNRTELTHRCPHLSKFRLKNTNTHTHTGRTGRKFNTADSH